ncbi:hypothetical protein [Haloglomus halophilum]|uniref:hypothetical protein n=1 Tax=Haloglomus halophilum TaxID=2962672 RepID=UPI0020C9443D|nr:hypothetical protein [Haloglomus halophilum]
MDDEAFFEQLRVTCADAVEAYRAEYPDAPPLTESLLQNLGGPLASEADLYERFDELTRFYDDLLEVDSTPYRDTWREHLVYDCSRRERLALLTSDLPESLTLVFIAGRYSARTGWIGVSPRQLPEETAYTYLASELCHAYQHRFDSPTWAHPYLQEGFEQAVSIRAQAYLGTELQHDSLIHLAERQRTKTLLEGVLAHGTRRGGIALAAVRELGVTDEELIALRSHPLWRPLGHFRPRYRWSDVAFLPEYALFGSLLLVSEEAGVSATYAQAFHGDHSWKTVTDEITASTPSWLWRLYRR